MQDAGWIATVMAGVCGFALGVIPKLVDALKAKKHEEREDSRSVVDQYDRLLDEIRDERNDVRKERETVKEELKVMRQAHLDCERRCAGQDVKILVLTERIEALENRDGQPRELK